MGNYLVCLYIRHIRQFRQVAFSKEYELNTSLCPMIERDVNDGLLYGRILIHVHLKTLNRSTANGKIFDSKTE
jgi:hypothetical protein